MSVAVITGASSGIGRALAIRAARAGYDVIGIGRSSEALASLAAHVRAEGGVIEVAAFDIADPKSARAIVDLVHRRFGRIDVLVNNAGHVAVGDISAQSDAALQSQFGTHVIGPLALVREALPMLRASKGVVQMLGSGVACVPVNGLGAYAPSKAAIRSATTILRRELAPDGIAVTYVDPGVVGTAFMTRAGMSGAPDAISATPETVARALLTAFRTRPRVVNAVPWQTLVVALAEFFPGVTDAILTRAPGLVGTQSTPAIATVAPLEDVAAKLSESLAAFAQGADETAHDPEPEIPSADGASAVSFDDALESVRRRMEKMKLSDAFVRGLLVADTTLDPSEVAMRWAGMPNKNERAATIEVLDALTEGGFLERDGENYRVVRTA